MLKKAPSKSNLNDKYLPFMEFLAMKFNCTRINVIMV